MEHFFETAPLDVIELVVSSLDPADRFSLRQTCRATRYACEPVYIAKRSDDVCTELAKIGHLSMLQWAVKEGFPVNTRTSMKASFAGHLHILKWLHSQNVPFSRFVVNSAANEDIRSWLLDNGYECADIMRELAWQDDAFFTGVLHGGVSYFVAPPLRQDNYLSRPIRFPPLLNREEQARSRRAANNPPRRDKPPRSRRDNNPRLRPIIQPKSSRRK